MEGFIPSIFCHEVTVLKKIPPIDIIERKVKIKQIRRQMKHIHKAIRGNSLCMLRSYRLMKRYRAKGHHRSANYMLRLRSRTNRDGAKLIETLVELNTEFHRLGREVVHIRQGIKAVK